MTLDPQPRRRCGPIAAALCACIVLAACGRTEPDRASGGAATGAGTGALIGLVGGPVGVVVGALVGAGVGAGTGAAVAPHHIDLGPPPWSKQNQSNTASAAAE